MRGFPLVKLYASYTKLPNDYINLLYYIILVFELETSTRQVIQVFLRRGKWSCSRVYWYSDRRQVGRDDLEIINVTWWFVHGKGGIANSLMIRVSRVTYYRLVNDARLFFCKWTSISRNVNTTNSIRFSSNRHLTFDGHFNWSMEIGVLVI